MEAYRHVPGFMTEEELRPLRRLVADRQDLLTEVHGRGGLGPRYRVIDGDKIHAHLAEVEKLGDRRVRPLAEAFAGDPYVALVTLENTNRGQTQFLSPRLSPWLRLLLYPLYAFPQIFSLLPRRVVETRPGDLLVMRGGRVLHRGVTLSDEGERILLAYTYDEPGRKPNPVRDWIARRLNY